jgi:hypothetical protein
MVTRLLNFIKNVDKYCGRLYPYCANYKEYYFLESCTRNLADRHKGFGGTCWFPPQETERSSTQCHISKDTFLWWICIIRYDSSWKSKSLQSRALLVMTIICTAPLKRYNTTILDTWDPLSVEVFVVRWANISFLRKTVQEVNKEHVCIWCITVLSVGDVPLRASS